jgi:hypothetical protein
MAKGISFGVLALTVAGVVVACGDDEDVGTGGTAGTGGSGDGSTSGGSGGEGGSAGTTGGAGSGGSAGVAGAAGTAGSAGSAGSAGVGGDAGSGGAAGGGGSAGSAGSAGAAGAAAAAGMAGAAGAGGSDAASCAPNPSGSSAALCLHLMPETMQTSAGEPDIDGVGILVVDVFDTPTPVPFDGGAAALPLARYVYPPQNDSGLPVQVPVDQLPIVRLENLPTTAYVRAIFYDNLAAMQLQLTLWGEWIGGINFATGIVNRPVEAISLTAGAGTDVDMPMKALRRVRALVSKAGFVTPADNAQGQLAFGVFQGQVLQPGAYVYGAAELACVDLSSPSTVTPLTGFAVGSGDYYVGIRLDDLGLDDGTPNPIPGMLYGVEPNDLNLLMIPDENKITLAADQYAVQFNADPLNAVYPFSPEPPTTSCPSGGTGGSGTGGTAGTGGGGTGGTGGAADASVD